MARRNQVVVLTPFTLAGAMAPVTVVGAVTQQNAEALAGLVLSQNVRPGAKWLLRWEGRPEFTVIPNPG